MIKERYCSYELSKLLKDKGFDEPCRAYWWDERDVLTFCDFPKTTEDLRYKDSQYLAPTHQMAMDWLRETYDIFIQINRDNQYHEGCKVTPMTKHDIERGHRPEYYARNWMLISESNTTEHFDDFYDCVEAALKYCLTKLIN